MAGDWIKIENVLPDKPEVQMIASILNLDPDAVVGKLCRIWVWADQQSINGNALRVTEAFLDRITCCTGFAKAMRTSGWLTGDNLSLNFPGFDRHNGQTAKARALTKNRVQRSRNGHSVTETLPEKRREENGRYIRPTLDQVLAYAKSKEIPEDIATSFWRHFESQDWVTKDGIRVAYWMPKLDERHQNVTRHNVKGNGNGNGNGSGHAPVPSTIHQCDSVIKECQAAIQLCFRQKQWDGPPTKELIPDKETEYKKLKARIQEMKTSKLGLKS